MLTQTFPLVWAAAISELVAAGLDAVLEEVFFAGILAGAAAEGDAALAVGAGLLIGFAAGLEAVVGAMALSLAADFFRLLFPLLVAAPGALAAAAGAFEDPAVAGVDASAVFLFFFLPLLADVEDVSLVDAAGAFASVDFLFFFLLVPVLLVLVEVEDLSADPVAVSSVLEDFLLLLFLDFVVVLLSAGAADWSPDVWVAAFFLLFFLLVVVGVVDVEEDWSLLELLCACISGANPKNTNNAVAAKSIVARGRFISSLLLAPRFRR